MKLQWTATNILCGLILIWFGVMAALGVNPLDPAGPLLIRYGALYGPKVYDGDIWRLISSLFVHVGFLHLLFNTYILFQMGRDLEKIYGSLNFLIVYFFSGICGSIVSTLVHPVSISAGASGAVFGLAGAAIAFYIRLPQGHLKDILKQWRNNLLVFIGLNIVIGLTIPMIDQSAHLGGLLGGFLMGLLLVPTQNHNRNRQQSITGSILILLLLIIFAYGRSSIVNDELALFRARESIENHDMKTAEKQLLGILERRPEDPLAHLLLGAMYYEQRNLDRAHQYLKKAHSLDPNYINANLLLINIALQKQNFMLAQKYFEDFERTFPTDPRLADLKILLEEAQKPVDSN